MYQVITLAILPFKQEHINAYTERFTGIEKIVVILQLLLAYYNQMPVVLVHLGGRISANSLIHP